MGLNIYLFFNGNCEEVMNFYAAATNGTIESLVRFSDTKVDVDEVHKNMIMHGVMLINDVKIMFSDTSGNRDISQGKNFSLSLNYTDEKAMVKVFNALSKGGTITMPIQDTFWGAKFGMCTDKYGINWMFNHDKPKY